MRYFKAEYFEDRLGLSRNASKILLKNVSSLFSIQFLNYLLPLITTPYLAYVIGANKLGVLAFSGSFMSYFTVIVDYGFNLSASREASLNLNDSDKIAEIYSSVFMIRSFLFFFAFLSLALIVYYTPKLTEFWYIYLLSSLSVFGNVLINSWFFQGFQKMQFLTYFSVISKFIATISLFILVKKEDDFFYVPLINGVAAIIVGLYAIYLVKQKFHVRFILPKIVCLKAYFLDGWQIFISNVFINIYTSSTTFILGIFSNYENVAYFSISEKFVQILKSVTTPISDAIYPISAQKFGKNFKEGMSFIKSATTLIVPISIVSALVVFIFANKIILLMFGEDYLPVVSILKIMLLIPIFVSVNNLLGVHIMLNINLRKQFSFIVFISSITSLILSIFFVPKYESLALSIILVFTEFFVACLMLLSIKKYLSNCRLKS
jgi:PST family polysaccharide transporter